MKLRSLIAVALLVPAAALAAPTAGSKSTAKPASSTAASKPAAPAKTAATPTSSGSPIQGLEVGGFLGYETDDVSGFSLRVDGEIPFQDLSPQVKLSWVGSLGYSRLTEDVPFGSFTVNLVKIVPAARFTLPLNPQFSVFGDAGLGLYYGSWKIETNIPFFGSTSISDSEFSIMMRIGAGAWYHVNEQLKLGAMLEFDPMFGDFDQNTFLVQAGAMFRL